MNFIDNFSSPEAIFAFLKQNLMLVVLVLVMIFRFVNSSLPVKEVEGSRVISVDSTSDWEQRLSEAKVRQEVLYLLYAISYNIIHINHQ